jgi:hypothetical protein
MLSTTRMINLAILASIRREQTPLSVAIRSVKALNQINQILNTHFAEPPAALKERDPVA